MDGFAGYKTAAAEVVPDAVTVMDPFHVVALAGAKLDLIRQRIQQQTLGRRGHTGDPLYGIRRIARTRLQLLSARQHDRLTGVLDADEHLAVKVAYVIYQKIIAAYADANRRRGKHAMTATDDSIRRGVPAGLEEIAQLGRTLWRRRADILAFFDHHASNGPTEAINGRLEALRRNALGFRNLTNSFNHQSEERGLPPFSSRAVAGLVLDLASSPARVDSVVACARPSPSARSGRSEACKAESRRALLASISSRGRGTKSRVTRMFNDTVRHRAARNLAAPLVRQLPGRNIAAPTSQSPVGATALEVPRRRNLDSILELVERAPAPGPARGRRPAAPRRRTRRRRARRQRDPAADAAGRSAVTQAVYVGEVEPLAPGHHRRGPHVISSRSMPRKKIAIEQRRHLLVGDLAVGVGDGSPSRSRRQTARRRYAWS